MNLNGVFSFISIKINTKGLATPFHKSLATFQVSPDFHL